MYQVNSRLLLLVSCIVLLAGASSALALSTDRQQPMRIRANSVDIDDQAGISIYKGKVVVVQGTLRITADTLTVIYDKKQKVKKMIAEGRPTTYKQRPDNKKNDVVAKAKKLIYFARKDTLVLSNNARIVQGGNVFRSQKIFYNLKKDQVRAGTAAGGKGRVNIVLEPMILKKKRKKKSK